ncbi:hypothetical protein CRENBAI_015687 [Crenichthys baileyi]|uniref:Uncharacterized protein n=1 Tax=Crenichthys baileyi TaxID=28760 RepID=A0AAV9S4V0_9TELE
MMLPPLCNDGRNKNLKLVLVVFRVIQDWVIGAADSVETPRLPSPQTPPPVPPGGDQGVPRPAERHSLSSMSPGPPPGGTCLEHLPRERCILYFCFSSVVCVYAHVCSLHLK